MMDDEMAAQADAIIEEAMSRIRTKANGEELTLETMNRITPDEVTLWGYVLLREELMDGGFVQLIHNGYAPFFFNNPFAKVMRIWGLDELAKIINKARTLYQKRGKEIECEMTDDEFMALYERCSEFDDLDDRFVMSEEEFTMAVAEYVKANKENFGMN